MADPAKSPASSRLVAARLRDLAHATDYQVWRSISQELDTLEGTDAWKDDPTSDDYDHLLLAERLNALQSLREAGASSVQQLMFHLAEGLHGNLGNIGSPLLYAYARVGTKALITDYVQEVVDCLHAVAEAPELPGFGTAEKIQFFKRAGTAFGRSALMLSGGGTLGMFHLGVIKALQGEKILPRVLSGSSAGAIIAGAVAVRHDAELPAMFDPGGLYLQAFRSVSLQKMLRGSTVMDGRYLASCLMQNMGDYTFIEAFERTGRIVGVTVSPAEGADSGRLLNYLTAPNVLLRTSVLASCAIPGIFPSVRLDAKDYLGQITPYMASRRWVDGTLANDLPMIRLARLHNVNHYIVSQTNPHVVPFMSDHDPRQRPTWGQTFKDMVTSTSRDVLRATRQHLSAATVPGRVVDMLTTTLEQRYKGDINIFPHQSAVDLLKTLSNPSTEDIARFIHEGERMTWPKIERIRLQSAISRAFEDCLVSLKQIEWKQDQVAGASPLLIPMITGRQAPGAAPSTPSQPPLEATGHTLGDAQASGSEAVQNTRVAEDAGPESQPPAPAGRMDAALRRADAIVGGASRAGKTARARAGQRPGASSRADADACIEADAEMTAPPARRSGARLRRG